MTDSSAAGRVRFARRSDEAVYEHSELLQVTLSSIGDAVITTDAECRVTFLNEVAQAVTGWPQAEAAGRPLADIFKIVNEETRRTVENPATRAMREGLVVGLANHTLLIARDGTERPIDDSAAPIRNARGGIAGVVLVFRDITERRAQERNLLHALHYADSIIATVRGSLLVLDQDLRIKSANRSFYQTFRLTPEETEGRHIYEIGDRQWDIPKLRSLLEEILPQNHAFQDYEVVHEFPGIGPKTMVLDARRVRTEGEPTEQILLAIEDVTVWRQAEARLRDSELRYRRLFEAARDGILILDATTGKICDSNPFMSELLGYSQCELLGKELWEIGMFDDRAASERAFRQLQERGHIRYDDLPLQDRSGRKLEVEFVSNVYDVEERPVIQCNVRDISERRQLERARVQTEALAQLHRRKDEFLAMLSHELRNPIAPIMNAISLLGLERDGETPTQRQARAIIERQIGQLKVLVDDLLEISRITSGRINLHRKSVDLRRVVDGALETAGSLISQRKHEVAVSRPAEPVWVHGDSTRLEQVVVNLLSNAAKYSEEGGHIAISLEGKGEEAVLRVRDTGIGIAPDLLPHIFDLFTQAERSLDRSQGGLGVGLTVTQKLVEMHNGRVEAQSEIGRGSEFIVHVPISKPDPDAQALSREGGDPHVGSLRVLVVDDNTDQADTAALLLRNAGHDVRVEYAGPAALDAAVAFLPDVVLLDIGLPVMNGYDVARRLRQQHRLKGVRLIAISGYGQDLDRERSRAVGFDVHLVKPVTPRELRAAVVGDWPT